MSSLTITFLTVTSIAMAAPVLVVAALVAIGVLLPAAVRPDEPTMALDRHTRADIGIAPGAITWLRQER